MKPENLRIYFILLLIAIITFLFLSILKPFFNTLFVSIVISSICYPIYQKIKVRLGNRKRLAAAISILLAVILIVLPILGILTLIAKEAFNLYGILMQNKENIVSFLNNLQANLSQYEFLGFKINIESLPWTNQIAKFTQASGNFIFSGIQKITNNILYAFFMLFIFIYSLYYLFTEGESFLDKILTYLPLNARISDKLLSRFSSTIKSTLGAALIIGILQGIIGGILFWLLGIPSPFFWGLMMCILSVLPAIGCNIVWFPASLILFFMGHWEKGLILLIAGIFVLNMIDYLLRPKLVGKNIALPPLVVLFATLGGLIKFGIIGFLLGPIIAALFMTLWQTLPEEIKT